MQADYSVELGHDDEALQLPWESPDPNGPRYLDLKRRPELLVHIPEAYDPIELGEFLTSANAPASIFETAKCDRWFSTEISEEESIYGASCKAGSYVDLLFTDRHARFALDQYEHLAQRLVQMLRQVPEISAGVELAIRRCYFMKGSDESDPGFYLTLYVTGYGDEDLEAWQRWGIALKLVQHALIQISAASKVR